MFQRAALFAFCMLPVALASAPVNSQSSSGSFFDGKQIKLSVGFSAGGSSSLYAQLLARHMGKYIPGRPNIIVQNMPGAGGLVVANYIYNTAARDGTEFAITARNVALEPLLGNKNARFDALQFNWIGNANVETSVCIARSDANVANIEDAFTKELVVGGSNSAAQEVMYPRAFNLLLGTKFKVVTGYPGSTEIMMALEKGEVQGFCGIGWTFLKLRKADMLSEKKVRVLFQMALNKHPDIPEVPGILDFAKRPLDHQILELLFAPQEMGRPFFAPPGVPPERVKALRLAFERTLEDPEFLNEAERQGLEIQYVSAEKIDRLLEAIYAAPRDVIERASALMN